MVNSILDSNIAIPGNGLVLLVDPAHNRSYTNNLLYNNIVDDSVPINFTSVTASYTSYGRTISTNGSGYGICEKSFISSTSSSTYISFIKMTASGEIVSYTNFSNMLFEHISGTLKITLYGDLGSSNISSPYAITGGWIMVAVRIENFNDGHMQFETWVNNVRIHFSYANVWITSDPRNFLIGAFTSTSTKKFKGEIGVSLLYDRVLSSDEMAVIYYKYKPRYI